MWILNNLLQRETAVRSLPMFAHASFFVLFFIHGFEMISKRVSVRNILGLFGIGRRSAWRKLGMFNNVIFLQGIMCLYMLTHENSNCFWAKNCLKHASFKLLGHSFRNCR